MSCDFRSFLNTLFLICISCSVFSAPTNAFAFQEKETEELIEELEEQLKLQVDEKSETEESSSAEDADTDEKPASQEGQEVKDETDADQKGDAKDSNKEEPKVAESEDDAAAPVLTDASDTSDETAEEETEEETEEITEESAEETASEDGDAETGMVLPSSGEEEVLTPKNIQWIWNLLFLFLTLCFLGWLLSLMTRKPEETVTKSQSNSDSSSGTRAQGNDLDFGKVYAARPSTVDDLTKIGGIDAAAQKRLNDAGIWQYDQLRKMTAQQRANLQRKLNLPRIRWYSLSGLGGGASSDIDSSAGSSKGNSASTGAAAAATGAAATASLASNSNGRDKSSNPNSRTTGTGSSGADGTSQRIDSELGNVYVRPPKFRDDLTRLEGVDAKTAAAMNAAGVYSFKQIESLSPVQRLAFEKRFGVSCEKMNLGTVQRSSVKTGQGSSGSASASSVGTTASDNASRSKPSTTSPSGNKTSASVSVSKGSGVSSGGSGADKTVSDKGSSAGKKSSANTVSGFATTRGSDGKGSSGNGAKIAGAAAAGAAAVAGAAASTTRRTGDAAVSATASAKISVADLVAAGKGRKDDTFGFLYTSPPADADDLTKLVGIDADAAKRLNAAGIYKFDQLSELDETQTAALARRFRLPNADFSDWRRCFYAWGRGIATTAEADEVYGNGMLHGIELPQIANGVFDGEKLVAYPEQIIFRGSNPEGWGKGNVEGIEGVESSLSCDSIRSNINYLRIRRTDTRESVVVPMTKGNIFTNGGDNENGWNGSSEVFFGGRHIGAFAQDLPQEVETKFSQGGWGFGHRYDHNDRQEWGWGGRVIEPTTFEVSVGCIGDAPGTVVFRSSDPSIWNTRTQEGDSRFAVPVDSVSHPVNFVRIMREATGEAVIVRVDGNHILDEGFDPRCGWNGSGSEFSGGMHLGAYHSELPQDFETRFEFGGWGFGHPYNDNDRQAWGWGGRQLPETVFEISLLESVSDFMQHEVIE